MATGREAAAYCLLAVGAFAVAVPAVRHVALRTGAVSRPNPNIRAHRRTVPLLGGPALITVYVLIVLLHRRGGTPDSAEANAMLAGMSALMVLGMVDDLRPLRPSAKLLWQGVICSAYVAVALREAGLLPLIGAVMVLLLVVNAYNVVDVMDGLLGLLASVAVIGLLVHPSTPGSARVEHAVLLIGLLAVLRFNRPPARLFFGDAGSLPLGFLVGAQWLLILRTNGMAEAAPAIALFAVPLLETALVVAARLRQRQSPLLTSPDHFALRLQEQLGWSQYRVLAITGLAATFWGAAPFLQRSAPAAFTAHIAGSVVLAVVLAVVCWRIPPSPDDPRRSPSGRLLRVSGATLTGGSAAASAVPGASPLSAAVAPSAVPTGKDQ